MLTFWTADATLPPVGPVGVVGVAPEGGVVVGYAGVVGDAFMGEGEFTLRPVSQTAPRGEASWGIGKVLQDQSTFSLDPSLDPDSLDSQEQSQHFHVVSLTDKQELIATPICTPIKCWMIHHYD